MSDSTCIDLLRHGEPVGGRKYRGAIDDALSDKGWQQMRSTVGASRHWDNIICSPLSRCHAFAEELSRASTIPLSVDQRLQEVGFGHWEGQTGDQLRACDPDVIKRFYHDPIAHRPEGAEPLEHFFGRVSAALDDIERSHAGRHVLVVTHAGVIRAAITRTLQAPLETMYRLSIETATLTRIRTTDERPPTVEFINRRQA